MKRSTFDRLLASLDHAVSVERGEAVAPLERVYEGTVLVEIREHGETTWRRDSGVPEPTGYRPAADPSPPAP